MEQQISYILGYWKDGLHAQNLETTEYGRVHFHLYSYTKEIFNIGPKDCLSKIVSTALYFAGSPFLAYAQSRLILLADVD